MATVALVLRLVPEALAEGRIAGQVEVVETGRRAAVRNEAELLAFLRGGFELSASRTERERRT